MKYPIIAEKLDSLDRCIKRLIDKSPATLEILQSDDDRQDIIAINLERAIQLCVDIASILLAETNCHPPQTMSEGFRLLSETNIITKPIADQLVKAVGFRNLSVHAYDKIDWEIVYGLLHDNVNDLRRFGTEITTYLES